MDSFEFGIDEDGHYLNGDANGDDGCNASDAVYIVSYIFKGGDAPCYFEH